MTTKKDRPYLPHALALLEGRETFKAAYAMWRGGFTQQQASKRAYGGSWTLKSQLQRLRAWRDYDGASWDSSQDAQRKAVALLIELGEMGGVPPDAPWKGEAEPETQPEMELQAPVTKEPEPEEPKVVPLRVMLDEHFRRGTIVHLPSNPEVLMTVDELEQKEGECLVNVLWTGADGTLHAYAIPSGALVRYEGTPGVVKLGT